MQGETREWARSPAVAWGAIAFPGVGALLRGVGFDTPPVDRRIRNRLGSRCSRPRGGLAAHSGDPGPSPRYYRIARGFVDAMGDSRLVVRLPSLLADAVAEDVAQRGLLPRN